MSQSGTYNGIDTTSSDINGTYTSISNVTLDSYDITLAEQQMQQVILVALSVTVTQNRLFDVLNLGGIQTMTVPNTNIDFFVRTTTGRSIHGSETEFTLTHLQINLLLLIMTTIILYSNYKSKLWLQVK